MNESEEQIFKLLVDTGSSWNWVYTCSEKFNGDCPNYYFNYK